MSTDDVRADHVRAEHGVLAYCEFCTSYEPGGIREWPCDAIQLADRLDHAERVIEAVRELHIRIVVAGVSDAPIMQDAPDVCRECFGDYPCRTLAALDAALTPTTEKT